MAPDEIFSIKELQMNRSFLMVAAASLMFAGSAFAGGRSHNMMMQGLPDHGASSYYSNASSQSHQSHHRDRRSSRHESIWTSWCNPRFSDKAGRASRSGSCEPSREPASCETPNNPSPVTPAAVPTPAALPAGLIIMTLLGGRRRRKA